jgi:ketosteroid isomerase-like protein
MNVRLPQIISDYVNASNAHDVNSILACFSNKAIVHDEAQTLHGTEAIEGWIKKTIEKYKFHFLPLRTRGNEAEIVVAMKVSGTFDGSPVTLDYHFVTEDRKITSLLID